MSPASLNNPPGIPDVCPFCRCDTVSYTHPADGFEVFCATCRAVLNTDNARLVMAIDDRLERLETMLERYLVKE